MPLNGTRIAANHGLFISVLRMSKAVRMYMASQELAVRNLMLSDAEIADALAFEAILYIVSKTTTLAQYENLFNGAIMVAIKAMTFRELRGEHRARTPARALSSASPKTSRQITARARPLAPCQQPSLP